MITYCRSKPRIAAATLGPRSRCCQSTGMPPEVTSDPPPHLSPTSTTLRPQIALRALEGRAPIETSIPVAGQVRCVDVASEAVGLPRFRRSSCSLSFRKPEMMRTERPVSLSKRRAATVARFNTRGSTPHRSAWAHSSCPLRSSGSLAIYHDGMAKPRALGCVAPATSTENAIAILARTLTVPAPKAAVSPLIESSATPADPPSLLFRPSINIGWLYPTSGKRLTITFWSATPRLESAWKRTATMLPSQTHTGISRAWSTSLMEILRLSILVATSSMNTDMAVMRKGEPGSPPPHDVDASALRYRKVFNAYDLDLEPLREEELAHFVREDDLFAPDVRVGLEGCPLGVVNRGETRPALRL